MLALLQQSGISRGVATAGTLLVRLVTLWFAVALGLAALLCLSRLRPGSIQEQNEPDRAALHAQP